MNWFETALLLTAIPLGLVAAGYWLAAGLRSVSAAERLAVAMLAGLGAVIWTVSVVNLALPLRGIWGWTCVVPLLVPLLRAETRRGAVSDFVATFGHGRGAAILGVGGLFLGLLLWPLLSRPGMVYYDGSSGHDGFFWVVGAEHLKRQSYLQPAVTNPVYPLYYSVDAITGLRPIWGRMGAEGLLALISNLAGLSPLKLYLVATAALFFPWLAAVYLVARTFVLERIGGWGAGVLIIFQPLFVFFHANANLPNLVGIVAGAAVVVGVARATASIDNRAHWLALSALGTHALLCAYPEAAPAIAVPAALLLIRGWWRHGVARAGWAALGATAGLGLNPVTTIRAVSGFAASWAEVAHGTPRPAVLAALPAAAKAPALFTLSVPFGQHLGAAGGLMAGVVLAVALFLVLRHARDRFGAGAMLTGGASLLVYAGVTGYGYGWQKAAQCSAIFLAALLPLGLVGRRAPGLVIAVLALFAWAGAENFRDVYKWSGRKYLTWDWFGMRAYSRQALKNIPVRVEPDTFGRPFFYSMWAAYFLDESRIYYAGEATNGGYLRPSVEKYPPDWMQAPRAVLLAGPSADLKSDKVVWKSDSVAIALVPERPRP